MSVNVLEGRHTRAKLRPRLKVRWGDPFFVIRAVLSGKWRTDEEIIAAPQCWHHQENWHLTSSCGIILTFLGFTPRSVFKSCIVACLFVALPSSPTVNTSRPRNFLQPDAFPS